MEVHSSRTGRRLSWLMPLTGRTRDRHASVTGIFPDGGHEAQTAGPRAEPNVLRFILATRSPPSATRVIQARIET